MDIGLETHTLFVTGAASGIGRAIAEKAADTGVGALMLTDIEADGLANVAKALGDRTQVETVAADLADPDAPKRICDATIAAFGRIDGLVNAAGLTTRGSFLDGTPELWDTLFSVNARAPFLLMQAAIKQMMAQENGGAIVNIQSVNAHCGAPELAIYSATKGALQTLTRNAANAHLKDGIRVNGINLGWTLTEAEDRLQAETLKAGADWAARAGQNLPLGRLLVPEEAAQLAAYLLSPVSAPLTGASIDLEQYVLGAPR